VARSSRITPVLAVVRPADDAAAVELSAWGDEVRRTAASAHPSIIDCAGSANVNRAAIDNLLSAGPDHLLWVGHGRDDALIAHSSAMVDSANVGQLSGGVVVAIACLAARALGPDSVYNHGVRAFLGFDDVLGWPANAPGPMRDAIVDGLAGLATDQHDVDDASRELRARFASARMEYEHRGAVYGLTAGDSLTAWLFAKSNGGSVRVDGDGAATLA
jgi:hypothetical protein